MQLAIFELVYETQSITGPNYLTTGNFNVATGTDPIAVNDANAYISEVLGLPATTNVQAAYLNGFPTTGRSTGSQGLLVGDSLNFGNVPKASPAINTVAGGTVIIGSGVNLTDTAVLSGGSNPTGTITFNLYYNGGSTPVDTETASVSGDNTYSTPTGYLPSATGSYVWSATYNGDSNNNTAHDNGVNESETVIAASPALNTVAGGTVIIGSGVNLTDTAVLSGGSNPTGTITFNLYYNGGSTPVNTETASVSGDNTYSTPTGYLPSATGSYVWSATYNGDSNNNKATDNGQNESETVIAASPGLNTVAGGTVIIGSGVNLTDTAVLFGGSNPTGTITFNLYYNGGSTPVNTETASVSGDNTYSTPTGYLPSATGSYVWSASYSGDSNNNPATDNGVNESETVIAASPAINTMAGGTVIIGSGVNLTDTAVLSGGSNPTGTITFNLYYNGGSTPVNTETASVSGDNTYSTPTGYLPTATGSYVWSATYNGDSNNNKATDNGQNESETVIAASPAITTQAAETNGGIVGSAVLSDSASLTGGFNPGGTITFTLKQPDGSTITVGSAVTVTGDGSYTPTATVTATEVGTYTWHAHYSGDSSNNSADDNGANEGVTTIAASPAITTQASRDQWRRGRLRRAQRLGLPHRRIQPRRHHHLHLERSPMARPSPSAQQSPSPATAPTRPRPPSPPPRSAPTPGTLSYSGDSSNNGADDDGANEGVTTIAASPAITTQASEVGNVVGSAVLSDSASLTGGFNPGGTITFTLTAARWLDHHRRLSGHRHRRRLLLRPRQPSSPPRSAPTPGTPATAATPATTAPIDDGANEARDHHHRQPRRSPPRPASVPATSSAPPCSATRPRSPVASTSGGTITFTLTAPDGTTIDRRHSGHGHRRRHLQRPRRPSPPPRSAPTPGTPATAATPATTAPIDDGANESVTTVKASPADHHHRQRDRGNVVGTAVLQRLGHAHRRLQPRRHHHLHADRAQRLDDHGRHQRSPSPATAPTRATATVIATQVGTYTWHASYSGDACNNGADRQRSQRGR